MISTPPRIRLLIGVVGAAIVLGACGSSGTSGANSPTSSVAATPVETSPPVSSAATTMPARSTVPAPSTVPATTPTTAPTTGMTVGTTIAATTRCRASALSASLGQAEGAAGSTYLPLVVRNVGAETCLLSGRPGVSLLDSAGVQIGEPAVKDVANTPKTWVELLPGAEASALLRTTNGPIGGPCTAPSVQMKVYPPNEFDAIVFPANYTACGGFSVRPFVAGNTGL